MDKGKYIERDLTAQLVKWLGRKEILAIKGPRQSGKTTLLQLLKEHILKSGLAEEEQIIFRSFEDRDELEQFTVSPKTYLKSYLQDSQKPHFFLLDEYQYVRQGGQKLKLLFDSFPNVKFIITGSSSLELISQTGRYLVGRMFSFNLYPLSFSEFLRFKDTRLYRVFKEFRHQVQKFLEAKLSIIPEDIFIKEILPLFEEYCQFGGYPEVVKTDDYQTKIQILKNIADTYVEKDIIQLLKIESITEFRLLTRLMAAQIGQLINYQQLCSDTKLHFKKVKHFLSVLEETYLIKTLLPFSKNQSTEIKKNPKIYFLDPGLRNYFVASFSLPLTRPDKGSLIENTIFTNLIYHYQEKFWKINFWRTFGGAEVDFILFNGLDQIPIEVKYSSFKTPKIIRGYRSFLTTYKPNNGLVLTKDFWGKTKIGKTSIFFAPCFYI